MGEHGDCHMLSSATMTSVSVDSFEHAQELMIEGKRDLLIHAIPDAVSNFSEACELMVKHKGETAIESAEAYLYYGRALLELSRVEAGVLGNALDGEDMESKTEIEKDSPVEDIEAMTTDEKSEIEAKVADALKANFETHDLVARAHSGEIGDEESEEEMMEGEEEEKARSGEGMGSEEKMDFEVGNLELAWQMFELAKVIFSKAGNLIKECESLTLLGEVSLENSNYKQAMEDLTTCLARRCAGMPADSRSIAETHSQLGVAQAHSGDYASAEKSLRAAISVLNARMSNLKKMEVSENITKELSDLETLVYEIKERTSDHKEMQRGTYKEDKDFVPMYNDVKEIVTRKSTITG